MQTKQSAALAKISHRFELRPTFQTMTLGIDGIGAINVNVNTINGV